MRAGGRVEVILGAPAAEEPVAPWAPGSCPARLLEALPALDASRGDRTLPSVSDAWERGAPLRHVIRPEGCCEAAALEIHMIAGFRSEEIWERVRAPQPRLQR